jgi:drug/metabolite transporter (DMT)-like permease
MVAILSWGVWAILSRVLGDAVSAVHSQVLSTVGMVPIFLVMLPWVRAFRSGHAASDAVSSRLWRGRGLAFAGGIVSCLGNVAYYQVLSSGQEKAITVVPLTALYPVVTILLAVLLLGERLNPLQSFGVVLSMTAIYLLNVQTDRDWLSIWLLATLVPIVLWGVTGFLQKVSTHDISGEASAVWFLLAFLVVAPLLLWYEPLIDTIAMRTWMITFVLGFMLAFGNYAILAAFAHHGKAAIITPLSGLYPLVSIPLAAWWFQERMGMQEAVGIMVSLLAVTCLSLETKSTSSETSS